MGLRVPRLPEILACGRARGRNSCAPELWNGVACWWPGQEGGGGIWYDVVNRDDGTLTSMAANDWTATEKLRADRG